LLFIAWAVWAELVPSLQSTSTSVVFRWMMPLPRFIGSGLQVVLTHGKKNSSLLLNVSNLMI